MFQHLTDLAYQRTFVQAIGFYLFYGLIGLIMAAIGGGLAAATSGAGDFNSGYQAGAAVGPYIAVLFEVVLTFLVLHRKGQMSNPGYVALILVSAALAYFAGIIGGNLVAAFVSTRAQRTSPPVPVQGQ